MGSVKNAMLEAADKACSRCEKAEHTRTPECIRCGEPVKLCADCAEEEGDTVTCDYCRHVAEKDD